MTTTHTDLTDTEHALLVEAVTRIQDHPTSPMVFSARGLEEAEDIDTLAWYGLVKVWTGKNHGSQYYRRYSATPAGIDTITEA